MPNSSTTLIHALIAYSVYEHRYEGGTATQVKVHLTPRSCTLEDDGRGVGLHREGYVRGLVEQLSPRQSKVALHGLGLAIVAMSAPSLLIRSRRDGWQFTQTYAWGVSQDDVRREPWSGPSGTCMHLALADEAPAIDFDAVQAQLAVWRAAHPDLQIALTADA